MTHQQIQQQNVVTEQIRCPSCGSNQVTANKRGFSAGKAIVGGLATGGIGLLAGFHGSRKVEITCLNCGHVFRAGDVAAQKAQDALKEWKAGLSPKQKQDMVKDQLKLAGGMLLFIASVFLMVKHWAFIAIVIAVMLIAAIADKSRMRAQKEQGLKSEEIPTSVLTSLAIGCLFVVPVALAIKGFLFLFQ